MKRNKTTVWCGIVLFLCVIYLSAQTPTPSATPRPTATLKPIPAQVEHAPMELWGVGPEMFGNRGAAWAKNIGAVVGECISQFGISLVAIFALIKLIRTSGVVDEVQKMKERQDRQGDRLDKVALAVPAVTNGGVTIPNADVKIQPKTDVAETEKPIEPAQT